MKKLLTKEQLEAIEACASNVENFDTCLGCPANDGEIDCYRDPATTALMLMNRITDMTRGNDVLGRKVKNRNSDKIGVVLKINASGSIQVLEEIEPFVICTHDSWDTLQIVS